MIVGENVSISGIQGAVTIPATIKVELPLRVDDHSSLHPELTSGSVKRKGDDCHVSFGTTCRVDSDHPYEILRDGGGEICEFYYESQSVQGARSKTTGLSLLRNTEDGSYWTQDFAETEGLRARVHWRRHGSHLEALASYKLQQEKAWRDRSPSS